MLEKKLASSDVSEEEQINLLKDLEHKETQYMRLKRHKICVDDFELLIIIGRGAFGEVREMTRSLICIKASFGSSQNNYSIDMPIKNIVRNLGHTVF